MINNWQLKKRGYLISKIYEKLPHFDHFPRPGEIDPYDSTKEKDHLVGWLTIPESRCGHGKEKRDNQAMPDNMQVLNCVFEYNDNYYYEEVITSISNITRKNEKWIKELQGHARRRAGPEDGFCPFILFFFWYK